MDDILQTLEALQGACGEEGEFLSAADFEYYRELVGSHGSEAALRYTRGWALDYSHESYCEGQAANRFHRMAYGD